MNLNDKRYPAYEDTDIMPFGKHKGELMSEVPARYLLWFSQQDDISDLKLKNYIWNAQQDIKQETGESIGIK